MIFHLKKSKGFFSLILHIKKKNNKVILTTHRNPVVPLLWINILLFKKSFNNNICMLGLLMYTNPSKIFFFSDKFRNLHDLPF